MVRTPDGGSNQTVAETQSQAQRSVEEIAAETERWNAWFEETYEAEVLERPIQVTLLGRDERQSQIDDFSEAAFSARHSPIG